jgi:hypothetical protein
VQLPLGHMWTMRNGQAVQMDAYADQKEALEAVGSSKQDRP